MVQLNKFIQTKNLLIILKEFKADENKMEIIADKYCFRKKWVN